MKKNIQKTIAVLGAAVLATGMVGCGSSNTNTSAADTSADSSAAESGAAADTTENSADTKDLSGSITLAGSTSMEKFANALAETFMEKYPNVTVQAEFTGSSAGIESVLAGQCDVGDSSRALKDDEKAKGAVENIVAIDGIAVVVDPSNAVEWSEQGRADRHLRRKHHKLEGCRRQRYADCRSRTGSRFRYKRRI